jgi:hypothetical protein
MLAMMATMTAKTTFGRVDRKPIGATGRGVA